MSQILSKVLLVEDNKLFKNSLASFINKTNDFKCIGSFSSCEEAIKEIKKTALLPDIILLDIGLPGINGVEGISHFKLLIPQSKIIMLTIQDDDENIFKSICNGASGYLLKDSASDKILEALTDVSNGGAPMNSSIAARVLKMFKDFVPQQVDYNLTDREKEILKLLVDGYSKKQIAAELFLSYHTIDSHMRNIYQKLEVHSNSGAVAKALKENII